MIILFCQVSNNKPNILSAQMFQPIGIHERKSAGWGTVEESFKETDMTMVNVNDTTFFTVYYQVSNNAFCWTYSKSDLKSWGF
jgi:hypothetical protein